MYHLFWPCLLVFILVLQITSELEDLQLQSSWFQLVAMLDKSTNEKLGPPSVKNKCYKIAGALHLNMLHNRLEKTGNSLFGYLVLIVIKKQTNRRLSYCAGELITNRFNTNPCIDLLHSSLSFRSF